MNIGWVCGWMAALGAAVLPNGDFEIPAAAPLHWEAYTWAGAGELVHEVEGGRSGRAVRIHSEAGGDLSWSATVAVEPHTTYRLAGWIKTVGVAPTSGKGALLNVHRLDEAQTAPLTGDHDWTAVETIFETADREEIRINCLFGGWGLVTGTAWFDDVTLEPVEEGATSCTVGIDRAATGPAISPYIYGQFIEHLGRCIEGGIWAEMLADRKFFFEVGQDGSPWLPLVAGETIAMPRDNPYVGDHQPLLAAGQGMVQTGLGVRAGKTYTGRIVLAGTGTVVVRLVWGEAPEARQEIALEAIEPAFTTYPLEFSVTGDSDDARLEIVAEQETRIGPVSLMPGDNVEGLRADTLALLKELNSPVYRWPGGNFVSGYDWRDGIGDRDRRPPRKNPAWQGVEYNDFGMHEFLRFCEILGTEAYIAVNSGLGDVAMARAEVEYVLGGPETPMGQWRGHNGRVDAWPVKFWGIGNEMYGNWQLGHMPLSEYVAKHNTLAAAMREVSPDLQLVGVGATGPWTETMLAECANTMVLLSEHFYLQEKASVPAHVRAMRDEIRTRAAKHREYHATIPALQGKFIPIAMDEWNYWYGEHVFGELGTRYFQKDGLGVAVGLHEYFRNSDVYFMANYAQTVNVIGAIKTSKTAAALETTGLVLKLYRAHWGDTPLTVTGDAGALDVAAALADGGKRLTIGIVNPTKNAATVTTALTGFGGFAAGGTIYRLAGDPMAYNDPATPNTIAIADEALPDPAAPLVAPPYSVSLAVIPLE